jgi:hypothetical protein
MIDSPLTYIIDIKTNSNSIIKDIHREKEGKLLQNIIFKQRKIKTYPVLFIVIFTLFLVPTEGSVLSALPPSYLIESSDNTLRYTFFFDEPVFHDVVVNNKTFTTIDMTDCFSSAQPGFPKLPMYRVLLLLPKGYSVASIQGSYQNQQILSNEFLMKPLLPEQ